MALESRRVVVITGASAGIGRATAVAFGSRGWRVALLARGREGLEGAREEVLAVGGEAMIVPADVADPEQLDEAAAQVEHDWGAIDVWVNNAMATIFSAFMDITPEEFLRATEVTYLGAVWGTRAALKRMAKRNRGAIVQVGSALAYRSIPLQSPYCGAKSALRGFTDSLRSELIRDGSKVHLTMVHLSAFNTPQFDWGRNRMGGLARPLGKIFQPELAAEAIFWAARQRRREVWVGFPAVQAILANRIVPGMLDRILAYKAYEGQHADAPLPANYQDNLYEAVREDRGARGRFSDQALASSAQFWLSQRRSHAVAACVAALLALGIWLAGGNP